jgi:hypothetical protein
MIETGISSLGIAKRISTWVGHRQRELADRTTPRGTPRPRGTAGP